MSSAPPPSSSDAHLSCGSCNQQKHPCMFSSSLQHVRFEGAALLCDACICLVPPSPQLDAAAQQAQELRTLWTIHCVGVRVRSKRGFGVLAAPTQATADLNISQPPPAQRKRRSRGSAIVSAVVPDPHVPSSSRRLVLHRPPPPSPTVTPAPNRNSAIASWVARQYVRTLSSSDSHCPC